MDNISVIKAKLSSIIGCITQYTKNADIIANVNSLETAISQNDYEMVLFLCTEIDKWFDRNIKAILCNPYLTDKESYKQNTEALKDIISELVENEGYYREAFSVSTDPARCSHINIDKLLLLFDRFHKVVVQLRKRHENRHTLDVGDEYDVQDLLQAILQLYCDDIRVEEWTPSLAGTCSRQDFLLKEEKIVIETKMTRHGLGNRELADQLIIDIARYKEHPDCKTLLCFVYDPENRISNPRGFERDLSKSQDGLNVIARIRP